MSTNFLERSRLERKVLGFVNAQLDYHYQLSGLSSPTVTRWRERLLENSSVSKVLDLDKVERLLTEISSRIRSDADSSKHIFVEGIFKSNATLDVCIHELEVTMDCKKP